MNTTDDSPFGTYKLSPIRERLIRYGVWWRPRVTLISSIIRKIARIKSIKGPVDIELFENMKVRLYPKENGGDFYCLKGTYNLKHEAINIYRTAIQNTKYKIK